MSNFFSQWSKQRWAIVILLIVLIGVGVMKGGSLFQKQGGAPMAREVEVKAMQVVQKDAQLQYEFVGKVQSKNEVKIISKVSGNVVEKMVKGGDTVYKGQPLFRIDDKQYQSSVRSAQATLNQSEAALNNARKDLARYEQLAAINGISQQTLDAQASQTEQYEAAVAANRAKLQESVEDSADTLILSPVDGRVDVNDVSIGQFVTAGSTTLATVSSLDPIWVQFSMSENEYLKFAQMGNGSLPDAFKQNLKLTLANGAVYGGVGTVEQIDKGISTTTGTITMKASFDNAQKLLLPGMFGRIVAMGEVKPNALLIPQRAVKELLDSNYVIIITADNKAERRAVKMGGKVGNMWIVESGLTADDRVIVEGIDKVKSGAAVKATMLSPEQFASPAQ